MLCYTRLGYTICYVNFCELVGLPQPGLGSTLNITLCPRLLGIVLRSPHCHGVLHVLCYICVPLQENPYVMLRPNHQEMEGNERYEGFCVDMLKELADILKFKYCINLVGDGVYGVSGTNGTWTGMVGELISRVRAAASYSQPY